MDPPRPLAAKGRRARPVTPRSRREAHRSFPPRALPRRLGRRACRSKHLERPFGPSVAASTDAETMERSLHHHTAQPVSRVVGNGVRVDGAKWLATHSGADAKRSAARLLSAPVSTMASPTVSMARPRIDRHEQWGWRRANGESMLLFGPSADRDWLSSWTEHLEQQGQPAGHERDTANGLQITHTSTAR